MMQRYRFVGSYTEIADRLFSRFGQTADWDENYYGVVAGFAPFIPDSDFKKILFTQDEFDRYADYGNRALAPESFNAKVKQCAIIWHEIREKLKTRGIQEEIAPAPEVEDSMVPELPAASMGRETL